MNKIALITGVNGQDGSYLAELLLGKNYIVFGLDRPGSSNIDHENFTIVRGDLRDSGFIWKLIHDIKPDEVYNLAAQSNVRLSFAIPEETISGICLGTMGVLEAIKNIDPTIKFYQASSSEMYGKNSKMPYDGFTEECSFNPISPYACAKAFAHNLVQTYRLNYGIHASCGILFNHESPRREESFVTKKITMAAAKIKLGLQDKLYLGNLDSKRDWGFAGDYVKAMWLMLQQENSDDYIVSTGETASVKDFLNYVFDYAGLGNPYKYVKIDDALIRKNEMVCVKGNSSKARNNLGWKPEYNLEKLAAAMFDVDYNKLRGEYEN